MVCFFFLPQWQNVTNVTGHRAINFLDLTTMKSTKKSYDDSCSRPNEIMKSPALLKSKCYINTGCFRHHNNCGSTHPIDGSVGMFQRPQSGLLVFEKFTRMWLPILNISKTIHKTYFLKLFHFGKITKAILITMYFWISLVFMSAWSHDNRNYQIITFDCTDDIHLHYFCQSLSSSGEV